MHSGQSVTARRSPLASVSLAAASCVLLVSVSMLFLDRPWSTWANAHLHDIRGFVWLTWLVDPVPPLIAIGLAGTGVAALAGQRSARWSRVVLACCLAAAVSIVLKDQLKYAFGRTWPETWIGNNPSWIQNGIFGFQPFHGGPGWASFPSGHTTVIAAPMAVLWQMLPRWRWLWGALVALVAIGLLGADYHWPSDVIAGAYLGAAVGFGLAELMGGRN
jgi:membrane-associated phospholipid phosphatase